MACHHSSFNEEKGKENKDCSSTHVLKIPLKNLNDELLGMWNYHYSYKNDTCFQIAKLGDLSRRFEFKPTNEDSMQMTYPKLYSFAKDKTLFGLISTHEKVSSSDCSYPLVNYISKDSTFARITHYVCGNRIGKSYSYHLRSLSNDTLIISNQRNYNIDAKKMSGVRHIYFRTK